MAKTGYESPFVIQGRPVYHARTWEAGGIFGIKATFTCGQCARITQKAKVTAGNFPKMPEQAVLGQCQWCGDMNAFLIGNRQYLVFT